MLWFWPSNSIMALIYLDRLGIAEFMVSCQRALNSREARIRGAHTDVPEAEQTPGNRTPCKGKMEGCNSGPQRPSSQKGLVFSFKGSRQGGFLNPWFVEPSCLCGLWGPF